MKNKKSRFVSLTPHQIFSMTQTEKKLMILGAGLSQLSAIQRAVDMGFYVITVDYLPENIGHLFSHQFVNCSTVDKEKVLKAARDLDIDGIVTFASDVATPTMGFVSEQLGLPGASLRVAETLSNKGKFRIFQKEHGLNSPDFVIGQRLEDIKDQISTLSPPLVFKPVDTSGSRGVCRLDQIDHNNCFKSFEYARTYSRSKTVCVEKFIEGTEVGGDAFLINGKLAFVAITHKHMKGYVVTGHSLPTDISLEDQRQVCSEIVANCLAVGYTEGPLNFDVIVSPERSVILEMSPRLGGNGIPMIIKQATGIDLIAATIYHALGLGVEPPSKYERLMPCGSWIFGSNHAGMLEGIATKEEIQTAITEVFDYVVNYHIGDEVPGFIHNGNSLGYVLFDCRAATNYAEMVDRIQGKLQLKVSQIR